MIFAVINYSSRPVDIKKYRGVAPVDMSDEDLAQLIRKHNNDHGAISTALEALWQSMLCSPSLCKYCFIISS